MKILLVNAPVTVRNTHARLTPPLGLAYIGSALLAEGHQVSAIDLNVSGLNLSRIAGVIKRERPDMVGISAMTETVTNAYEVARTVKETVAETMVVMGGAHPTIRPLEVLASEDVDYVVVGDGERAMVELVSALSGHGPALSAIRGLGYKTRELHLNERGQLLHPDALLLPARGLFPIEFYEEPFNILTATGSCPFRCPFCSAAAIWEGRRNARSARAVVEELRVVHDEYGAEYVFFSDDIFTLDKAWVYELLEEMRTLEFRMRWGCATRADLVDHELLHAMAEAGCEGIQYGVESGSQQILDTVKHISKERVLSAVNAAIDEGIEIACSFMVPFPDDTVETIAETGKFMAELGRAGARVILNYTCPFPGTYFADHAEELGLTILPRTWAEYDAKHLVLETRNLSAEQIEEAVGAIVRDLGLQKSED